MGNFHVLGRAVADEVLNGLAGLLQYERVIDTYGKRRDAVIRATEVMPNLERILLRAGRSVEKACDALKPLARLNAATPQD